MKQESEKYNQILNILKKSKPVLDSTEEIEREVMKSVSMIPESRFVFSEVIDFLFGWVYIEWVRRSFIAASVGLVIFFIYQQGVILKQINILSNQVIVTKSKTISGTTSEIEKRIMMYKISGHKFSAQDIPISEKQMKEYVELLKEMKVKYKDIISLIEKDPELKKYIEEKLIDNNRTKIKL